MLLRIVLDIEDLDNVNGLIGRRICTNGVAGIANGRIVSVSGELIGSIGSYGDRSILANPTGSGYHFILSVRRIFCLCILQGVTKEVLHPCAYTVLLGIILNTSRGELNNMIFVCVSDYIGCLNRSRRFFLDIVAAPQEPTIIGVTCVSVWKGREADGGQTRLILPIHPCGVALSGIVSFLGGSVNGFLSNINVCVVIRRLRQLVTALIILHAVLSGQVDRAVDSFLLVVSSHVVNNVTAAFGGHIIGAVHSVTLIGVYSLQEIGIRIKEGHLKINAIMSPGCRVVVEITGDGTIRRNGLLKIIIGRTIGISVKGNITQRVGSQSVVHIHLHRHIRAVGIQVCEEHGRAGGQVGVGVVCGSVFRLVEESGRAVGDIIGGIIIALGGCFQAGIHVYNDGEGNDQLGTCVSREPVLCCLGDSIGLVVKTGDFDFSGSFIYGYAYIIDIGCTVIVPGIAIAILSGHIYLLYGNLLAFARQFLREVEVLRQRIRQDSRTIRFCFQCAACDSIGDGLKHIFETFCVIRCKVIFSLCFLPEGDFVSVIMNKAEPMLFSLRKCIRIIGGNRIHVFVGATISRIGVCTSENAYGVHRHARILQLPGGVDGAMGNAVFIAGSACRLAICKHNYDFLGIALGAFKNSFGRFHAVISPRGALSSQTIDRVF